MLAFGETIAGYANYGRNRARSLYYDGEVYELYLRPEFQGLGFGRAQVVQVDLVADAELAALELAQQFAGELGVGDENRIRLARDSENIFRRRALCHPQFGIEPGERFGCRGPRVDGHERFVLPVP